MLKLSGTNVIVNSSGQPIDCSTCPCGASTADPCDEFTDNFNRADSTNLGTAWVEESGDGQIASNTLQFTTPNSLVRTSSNYEPTLLEVTVRGDSAGDKARVFYSSTAGLSYGMEIEFGTNIARGYRNASGSITVVQECPVTVATNTDILLKFGHTGPMRGTVNGVDVLAWDERFFGDGNTRHPGCGTGDAVAGTVTFDDFRAFDYSAIDSACPLHNPGCWPVDNIQPSEITLVISGVANGSFGSESNLNGTYGLDVVVPAGIATREWRITGLSIDIGSGTTVGELAVGNLPSGGTHYDCITQSGADVSFFMEWSHTRNSSQNQTDGCSGDALELLPDSTSVAWINSKWTLTY